MCIICFLSDLYQNKLRNNSQLRTDRFEHTLSRYKYLFIEQYNASISQELCLKHNTKNNKNIARELRNQINTKRIEKLFGTLISVYIDWINSESSKAITLFNKLLKEYNLLDKKILTAKILYRGRESENFISHWDMFHIPFNRRYLIGNQRYSLIGEPLLYLAASPYCVVKELGNTENLKISSFRIGEDRTFEFYDNSNKFNSIIDEVSDDKKAEDYIKQENRDISSLVEKNIYKLILSSCCSFRIRKHVSNASFKEEYILPQVLAQILKEKKYDGILYTSTQIYDDQNIVGNYSKFNKWCINYCFFTRYDKNEIDNSTYVYDKELYKKFIISAPISYGVYVDKFDYDPKKNVMDIGELLSYRITLEDAKLLSGILDISMKIYYILYPGNKKYRDEFIYLLKLNSFFIRNIILNIKERYQKEDWK